MVVVCQAEMRPMLPTLTLCYEPRPRAPVVVDASPEPSRRAWVWAAALGACPENAPDIPNFLSSDQLVGRLCGRPVTSAAPNDAASH